MFATGLFSIDEVGVIITSQRFHEKTNPWDSDPASDLLGYLTHFEGDPDWHGYVSNVGEVATIHILKDVCNEKNIASVKQCFFLSLENGISEVSIEEWIKGDTNMNNKLFENYVPAPTSLLDAEPEYNEDPNLGVKLEEKARKLEETFQSFGLEAEVINILYGPSAIRFELSFAAGTKMTDITNFRDEIRLAMETVYLRFVAPVPGKAW